MLQLKSVEHQSLLSLHAQQLLSQENFETERASGF